MKPARLANEALLEIAVLVGGLCHVDWMRNLDGEEGIDENERSRGGFCEESVSAVESAEAIDRGPGEAKVDG